MKATTVPRVRISRGAEHPEALAPLLPTSWRWILAIYGGVPVLLMFLRPEFVDASSPTTLFLHYITELVSTLCIGAPLHAAYVWVMPRVLYRVESLALRALAHAAAIVGSVTLGKLMLAPILPLWCDGDMSGIAGSFIATAAATVVVVGTMTFQTLERRAHETSRREERARRVAMRAELAALQARVNPHFLFNSLNTVASLIRPDPACAEETVERLASLFRYALDSSRRASVPLADELSITRDYLDIETLRFGERLTWSIDVADALASVRVPPLVLQPLAENAVLHGVAQLRDGGTLTITGREEEGMLVLTLDNDCREHSTHAGTGTSLRELRRRLDGLYAGAAELHHQQRPGRYTVELRLPLEGPHPP